MTTIHPIEKPQILLRPVNSEKKKKTTIVPSKLVERNISKTL
jgi:hypothetical protein